MKRTGPIKRKKPMSRGNTLRRTRGHAARRGAPMVAKALGKSAVSKKPLRDAEHLARVRLEPCLVCGASGVEAHHLRIGLRTMGVRKSDHTAVPLCPPHHRQLHSGREEKFWETVAVEPLKWCVQFRAAV